MDKKIIISILIILVLVSSTVFGMRINNSIDINYDISSNNTVSTVIVPNIIEKISLLNYIKQKAGFNDENAQFLINICEEKSLDIFTVLAIMKVESNFCHNVVGNSGEKGIGQVMDNTARLTAKRLNIEYKPEYLYDIKYNITLFTEHLKYLKDKYDNDIHKMLTAYNRGRGGLQKYMASRANYKRPQESSYSKKVIKFMNLYTYEFEKEIVK
ncbi:lytic transglycosylase domain-containing protein [Abyssisolibacter fermentans]|uniref:lytic transglycosylase domain-containing protein n=1 Tax=Abyssisolibacter fermentans TaxID=1766203 RepID=UPI000829FAFA|nr:lytic transglycosylase domain-containing protein [Abyssisolibacter fermentans]